MWFCPPGLQASAEHAGQPAFGSTEPRRQHPQRVAAAPLAAGAATPGGAAAAFEAERQLRLLGQLKAHVQAASNEADSSMCPAPSPRRGGSPTAPPPPLLAPCCSPSAAAAAGPCASLLAPNASAGSLLAEDSCLVLDNLGLPLLGPADDDAPGLHMALMGPE